MSCVSSDSGRVCPSSETFSGCGGGGGGGCAWLCRFVSKAPSVEFIVLSNTSAAAGGGGGGGGAWTETRRTVTPVELLCGGGGGGKLGAASFGAVAGSSASGVTGGH